jgi:thiosulfate/3-mercaptopyruvate sulfurtransferase
VTSTAADNSANSSTDTSSSRGPSPLVTSPLVSTQWLADHLGSDGIVVADTTALQVDTPTGGPAYVSGDEQYMVHGHIPTSVFADIIDEFSDPAGRFGFARPGASRFERAAAALGVDNETTLIVYDNSIGQWAARLWWLFRSFGYDHVAVLDGGLKKWIAEGRPIEFGYVQPRPADGFTASERPELWADKASVARVVSGESLGALVCGLGSKEFSGATRGNRTRPGHIPGSIPVPAVRLIDRSTNAFLTVNELQETFAELPPEGTPVVAYCAAGIAAASDALALTRIGRADVAIYDGSLNEWVDDADAPVVTSR